MIRRIFLAVLGCALLGTPFWSGAGGCEEVATSQTGVFVPDVQGDYDLQNVTEDCADQFDVSVTIRQDERNLIIEPSSTAFTNLTGTIDTEGVIAANGASNFGTPFDCAGQFAGDVVSGTCLTEFQICSTDEEGTVTCVPTSLTCAFSYLRR